MVVETVSLYLESESLVCVGYLNQDVTDRPFRGPLRPRFSLARHVLPPESSDGCLGRWSPHRVQGRATKGGFLIRRMHGGCPCVYWD